MQKTAQKTAASEESYGRICFGPDTSDKTVYVTEVYWAGKHAFNEAIP